MCHTSRLLPVAIPLAAVSCGDGFVELEYTLALAKVTTLERGVHRSKPTQHLVDTYMHFTRENATCLPTLLMGPETR